MDLRKTIRNILFEQEKFELNESFLYRSDDSLKNVVQSMKNIFLNVKYSLEQIHKMAFFANHIKNDLQTYKNFLLLKYNKKAKKDFYEKFKSFIEEIDVDLIDVIQLKQFFNKVIQIFKNEKSTDEAKLKLEKVFDDYCNDFDDYSEKLLNKVKEKISNNEFYEPLKNINIVTSKIDLKEFLKQKYLLQIELLKLQEWVKDNGKKVLIVFEGRDAAGKGSAIQMFIENLNPKHYRVETFDIPTKEEKKKWFKRYKDRLPKEGEIVFFDRSWYNRGYVEPAMGYCEKKEYKNFMNDVNGFESKLLNSGFNVVKLWFSVSKDTQKLRFEARKSNPLKYWKFSDNDEKTMSKWDSFTKYINKMLKHTNTKECPWMIIDSNDYRNSKINAIRKVLSKFNYDEKDLSVLYESKNKKNEDKFIFLDIDGVLIEFKNEESVNHEDFNYDKDWHKEGVDNVNKLVNETGAKVVITSSYRKTKSLKELQDKFDEVGLKFKIHGITSNDKLTRGTEVEDYVKEHNIKHFVVIDDQNHDFHNVCPECFVKVTVNKGFSKENLNKAIKIFSKGLNENIKPTVVYSAVVIENDSDIKKLDDIFKKYTVNGWEKPANYHLTISPGKFPETLYLRGDLNKEVELKIESIGISDKAIAVGVSGYYTRKDNPHITIAFNKAEGGKPADSDDISNWEQIDNLSVVGTIREIGEKNIVLK